MELGASFPGTVLCADLGVVGRVLGDGGGFLGGRFDFLIVWLEVAGPWNLADFVVAWLSVLLLVLRTLFFCCCYLNCLFVLLLSSIL